MTSLAEKRQIWHLFVFSQAGFFLFLNTLGQAEKDVTIVVLGYGSVSYSQKRRIALSLLFEKDTEPGCLTETLLIEKSVLPDKF